MSEIPRHPQELPIVAPMTARVACQTCGGAGLTQALTRCASCAGAGGWSLAGVLRCERCGGRMAVETTPIREYARGASRELACLMCGNRRYVNAGDAQGGAR